MPTLRGVLRRVAVWRYLGVVAVNLLALVLAFLIEPVVPSTPIVSLPFVLLLAAVIYSSWYGGWLAGVAAVAFSGWTINYLVFVQERAPAGGGFDPRADVLRVALFVLVALLVSWVNGARAARQRAESSRITAERLQRWLQALLDLMPTPLVFLEPGTGRVTFANQAARQFEQTPREPGHTFDWIREAGIWSEGTDLSAPGSSPCELAVQGEQVQGIQLDSELSSGSRSLLVNAALLPAMHGQPATIVVPFQDITEMKRTEEALRVSEQRALGAERQLRHGLDLTRALTDSLGEGVLGIDREGRIFMANPAAAGLLGTEIECLLGTDAMEIVTDRSPALESAVSDRDALREAIGTGHSLRSDDACCRRADGGTFPIAYTLSPVQTGGTLIGSVLAFQDITQRKREEEALRGLAEERTNLVSTVSHALRAPIAAMLVNLDVLTTRTLGHLNREQQEYAETAIRSCEALGETVDHLLTISRLQAGRVSVSAGAVDVAELIGEVRARMLPRSQSRCMTLDVDLPSHLGEVTTDRRQLADLLTELIENGVKYGRAEGRILVSALSEPDCVRITVADDGPGFSPDEMEHLFDAFFRGEAALHDQVPGAGLGLSIVRQTAQLLGIEVTAANGPEGGALFTLTLARSATSDGVEDRNADRDDTHRRRSARDPGADTPHARSRGIPGGDGVRRVAGAGTV